MDPSVALLISIAFILVLLRLRLHPSFAVLVGGLTFSLVVLPLQSLPSLILYSLCAKQTLALLVVVASAMTLSSLMEEKGLLTRLAATIEGIGPRLAMYLVPAVIGLVPMPAGALVSATAVSGLTQRLRLTPERSTFINYWFRHVWEFSVPIYPTVIVTSVVLAVPLSSVVKTLAPMTALAIALGVLVGYQMLKKTPKINRGTLCSARNIVDNLSRAAWPILLLIALIVLRVDAMIAFPLTLVLFIGQQRPDWPQLKKAFGYGLNPRILLLLFAIMFYKATIESSGAAKVLVANMQTIGAPPVLIIVGLPLLMGLATGYGLAFSGVALPVLVPYIVAGSGINGSTLLLAFVSGMVGQLLSPMHLCFALSAEYFGANLLRVYRYTLPLTLAMEGIAVVVYYVTNVPLVTQVLNIGC